MLIDLAIDLAKRAATNMKYKMHTFTELLYEYAWYGECGEYERDKCKGAKPGQSQSERRERD